MHFVYHWKSVKKSVDDKFKVPEKVYKNYLPSKTVKLRDIFFQAIAKKVKRLCTFFGSSISVDTFSDTFVFSWHFFWHSDLSSNICFILFGLVLTLVDPLLTLLLYPSEFSDFRKFSACTFFVSERFVSRSLFLCQAVPLLFGVDTFLVSCRFTFLRLQI